MRWRNSCMALEATSRSPPAPALAGNDTAHMLFAYSDGANVHIADVEFAQTDTAGGDGTSTDT